MPRYQAPMQPHQPPQPPQPPKYQPDQLTIIKPALNDFKRRIDTQMSEAEIKNMKNDGKVSDILKT
jgi:hypothetical protein